MKRSERALVRPWRTRWVPCIAPAQLRVSAQALGLELQQTDADPSQLSLAFATMAASRVEAVTVITSVVDWGRAEADRGAGDSPPLAHHL